MTTRHRAPVSRRERRAQERFQRPHDRTARHRAPRARWQSPVLVTTIAALAVGLAVIVALAVSKPTPTAELVSPPTIYDPALVDGERLGKTSAPVVIELYSDFQCPACRMFVTQQLPSLVREFVATGALRIDPVDINVLGHGTPDESLELAAGAACAARQDRYWEFHDLVFWNQGRENRGDHDAAFIARLAQAAELDASAWQACLQEPGVRSAIQATTSAAAALGIQATPTLRINGRSIVGVPDAAQLRALITQLASAAGWKPA